MAVWYDKACPLCYVVRPVLSIRHPTAELLISTWPAWLTQNSKRVWNWFVISGLINCVRDA